MIKLGAGPWNIASVPSSNRICIANSGSNKISVLDTIGNNLVYNIPVSDLLGLCWGANDDTYVVTGSSMKLYGIPSKVILEPLNMQGPLIPEYSIAEMLHSELDLSV